MSRPLGDVQADLAAAYSARRAALIESYSVDTGQGKQAVTRNLKQIEASIRGLEAELAECGDPGGGIASLSFQREPE